MKLSLNCPEEFFSDVICNHICSMLLGCGTVSSVAGQDLGKVKARSRAVCWADIWGTMGREQVGGESIHYLCRIFFLSWWYICTFCIVGKPSPNRTTIYHSWFIELRSCSLRSSVVFLTVKIILPLEIGRTDALLPRQYLPDGNWKHNWVGEHISLITMSVLNEWLMGWGPSVSWKTTLLRKAGKTTPQMFPVVFNGVWNSIINNASLCGHHHSLCVLGENPF